MKEVFFTKNPLNDTCPLLILHLKAKRQLLFISRRNRELEQEAERARKLSFIEVDSKLVNEIQSILEIEKKVATRLLKEANGSAEKCLETFLDEEK